MRTIRAELHVHTVLSPCAAVEMIPPLIVSEALEKGIELIAVTDHNASANVRAVIRAAEGTGLQVLPGMELQTQEEVHLLCLFETIEQLASWQQRVDACLPELENNIEYFGEQFVVDETGEFIRREERLLINSAEISLDQACREVHALGGITIPAHIDRRVFSLIANLGFIPPGLQIDAVEISRNISPDAARHKFPSTSGHPLIQSGDVHYLNEFLGVNQFEILEINLSELRLAFQGRERRSMEVLPLTGSHQC